MAKIHRRDSFLKNAPTSADGLFLGLNKLPKIPRSVNDEVYEISHAFDERPDLLAHKMYGNSRLWWVFSMRNPDVLKDPIRDFKAGKKIILPSRGALGNITQQ